MSIPTEAFTLTYRFPAARDLVFRAFTRGAHLRRWWGPEGFTIAVCRFNFRPGGVFHYRMEAPPGHSLGNRTVWSRFVYQEIALPERIVLLSGFCEEGGSLTRHPMRPTWPMQVRNDFTFVEQNGQTEITLCATPYEATELAGNTFVASRALVEKDVTETFARLERYLARLDGHSSGDQFPSPVHFRAASCDNNPSIGRGQA